MDSFREAAKAIDVVLETQYAGAGLLQVGWSKAVINPPQGTPLAGFGERQGRPATGVHDDLLVKAVAISDGQDEAVIIKADMLIIPENVAERVRGVLATGPNSVAPGSILFNASHTHSGLGGWGPGLAAKLFAGDYIPDVEDLLVEAFVTAATAARENMQESTIAFADLDMPEFIRNRARNAGTDSQLLGMAITHEDGESCHIVSYGAHATILGADNMEYSGDYPAYLERFIEQETNGMGVFLAGAVGSMSIESGDGANAHARAEHVGSELGRNILDALHGAERKNSIDISAAGVPFTAPSYQFRLNRSWRLSPFLFGFLGVDRDAWIQGVRIGDQFLYGTPCDFSGEIAVDLKAWAAQFDVQLWVLSFNGDYLGYVSPDRYYDSAERGTSEEYEMYTMSWAGPGQEALFTEILHYMMPRMVSSP